MEAATTDVNQSDWAEADASNTSTPPNGWPSATMLPSQVEPAARAIRGAVKRFYNQISPTVTSGGTANAQTLTHTVGHTALVGGDAFALIVGPALTNTGSATLNVDGLGAKTIKLNGANLSGGELLAGSAVLVAYDGTNLQLMARSGGMSGWVNRQIITSTVTYTPTAGTNMIEVTIVAGGGAGGGAAATAAGQVAAGGGGGGAGVARARIVSGFSGVTVTIGAGGTAGTGNGGTGGNSTFGAVLTANGGLGGQAGGAAAVGATSSATGGGAVGGNINPQGESGAPAIYFSSATAGSGRGGNAPLGLGFGGAAVATLTTGNGNPGLNFGGGGGGGANGPSQVAAVSGGAGAPGGCIIDEYR